MGLKQAKENCIWPENAMDGQKDSTARLSEVTEFGMCNNTDID